MDAIDFKMAQAGLAKGIMRLEQGSTAKAATYLRECGFSVEAALYILLGV
jgi:hypothetical protein